MIDPKLIESAAKALGDARDRMLALLPEKNCLTCAHVSKHDDESPCDECIADPTSGHWTPKEPEKHKPSWDEVPEFGDEVEYVDGRPYRVLAVIPNNGPTLVLHHEESGNSCMAWTEENIVTRKAELRVGDCVLTPNGALGIIHDISGGQQYTLEGWTPIFTRADLKLIARGDRIPISTSSVSPQCWRWQAQRAKTPSRED